jgi:hypothetical protein
LKPERHLTPRVAIGIRPSDDSRQHKHLSPQVSTFGAKRKSCYVRFLVAATPKVQLAPGYQPRPPKGLSDEQLALMERESASLAREFKVAEQTYGADHLDLVLANGYVSKLLRNGRVVGYLAKNYQELLFEFQKITEAEAAAA